MHGLCWRRNRGVKTTACAKYEFIILYHTMQSRITITIPEELVEAADAKARSLDRSRSWVLVEALRLFLERPARPSRVREPAAPPYADTPGPTAGTATPVDVAAEVAASRLRRLRSELALPPLERLRRAEELARLGQLTNLPRASAQVVGFDTYEDYYEWKKSRLIRL